ncbi:transmembrane and ubiquitin-like domain-containing protein 1 [Phycodurus eques]|uniref:transmembrane and ubiquitin-like domain-containing protein 1 n=1 Tax=Phycodurus eques TaxID=693459 RepID=UPI002ACE458B|nr:transmembrane and ubiquitin-like domain-containing protein 1 [Phycodurus eques]
MTCRLEAEQCCAAAAMSLIEGVGDEVTLVLTALTAAAVLLLAWTSTRTSEPPHPLATPGGAAASQTASRADAPAASAPPLVDDKDGGGGAAGREEEEAGGDSQRNMVIRLKFLNDTERTAHVKPQDTVGYVKRTYFAGQERRVRLIYQGQLLQDDGATLEALRLPHNCVLHCHISQRAAAAAGGGPAAAAAAERVRVALNVGGLMVPLLALVLAVLWYCQIRYRHLFTAPASASLLGVTVFLSLLAFGVYRR